MRRSRFAIFASVSVVALLASLSVQAAGLKSQNIGTLAPQDEWRVGTVNAQGSAYCAMVNKFDKDAVVAVARDPQGYGSLALNFTEALFKTGLEYQTKVSTGGVERNINGKASSERSFVVQIGQDDQFFDAMNANGDLKVDMSVVDVTFKLGKFSDVYNELVDCSATLNKAATATADAPLDTELAALDGKKSPAPQQAEEAANTLDAMEATIEEEAKVEVSERKLLASIGASSEAKASDTAFVAPALSEGGMAKHLEQRQVAVLEQRETFEKQKQDALKKQEEQKKKDETAAKEIKKDVKEEKNTKVAKAEKTEKTAVGTKLNLQQARLEALENLRAAQKEQEEARGLDEKFFADSSKVSVNAGPKVEAVKVTPVESVPVDLAPPTAKQAPSAPAIAAYSSPIVSSPAAGAKPGEMTLAEAKHDELSVKRSEQQSKKIIALAQERDSLKRQLDQAMAFNAMTTPDSRKVEQLAAELAKSEQARLETENKLKEVYGQKTQSGTAVAALQKELNEKTAEVGKLKTAQVAVMAPVEKTPAEKEAIAKLQQEVAARDAQLAALQKEVEMRKTAAVALPEPVAAIEAQKEVMTTQRELSEKETALAQMEEQLKQAEAEKLAEAERARQAQEALEKTQRQLDETRKVARIENAIAAQPRQEISAQTRQEIASVKQTQITSVKTTATTPEPFPTPVGYVAPAKEDVRYSKAAKGVAIAEPAAGDIAEPASAGITPAQANKAEAFLDRIMSHHLGGAAPKPAADKKPWSASAYRPANTAGIPVQQAPLAAPTAAGEDEFTKVLNAAAGAHVPQTSSAAPIRAETKISETVISKPVEADQKPVVMASSAITASVLSAPETKPAAQRTASVTLESLLGKSGVPGARIVPVEAEPGAVVRQWSAGRIEGLYEQAAGTGNFDAQVQNYIGRYREDCPGNLDVQVGGARDISAGKIAEGSITCTMPSNNYSTAFIFLQDRDTFNAILHTGYPAEKAMVQSISENISYTLAATDKFIAPAPVRKAVSAAIPVSAQAPMPVSAPVRTTMDQRPLDLAPLPPPARVIAPAAAQPLKFNIRNVPAPENARGVVDEFGTVVIE